jgi:hypothetical protein
MAIRLHTTINIHLEDQGLATQRPWRIGGVADLRAVARRLGLEVMPPDTDRLRRKERGR